MTPHKPIPLLLSLALAASLVAFAACGGGDSSTFQPGQLTDPRSVPTASPWGQPPEVTLLDPNALQPLNPTPTPTASGGAVQPGVCGPKYTVASGDTFSSIAEKCGLSTQDIKDANPGVDPLTLHPGDEIKLPVTTTPAPSP